jgi:pyridoxine kinase
VFFLSIQSFVAYGHVGNSAATFPLQRLGHEVWAVPTVVFSNHTGYGAWRGPLLSPADVRAVVTGIEERGVLPRCDAVLSGYLGGPGICEVVVDAVARVRAANAEATYTCDPVMGNATSGCFVDPALPPVIRGEVVPHADLITPNQFELGLLTGTSPDTLESTLAAADAAMAMGPSTVLVTSVLRPDRPEGTIEMLAVTGDGAWSVRTPRLPMKADGSGDLTAALFTAHVRSTGSAAEALGLTASSVVGVVRATIEAGERELQIVRGQDAIASPTAEFGVEQVR